MPNWKAIFYKIGYYNRKNITGLPLEFEKINFLSFPCNYINLENTHYEKMLRILSISAKRAKKDLHFLDWRGKNKNK